LITQVKLKCDICGRELNQSNKCYGYILCNKHYQQYLKFGEFLDNNPRTENDKNEIVIYKDYAEIFLYNRKQEVVAKTKIDIDDIEKCTLHKWRYWDNTVVTGNNIDYPIQQIVYYVLGLKTENNTVIDHINCDRMDNRKSNLRITTQAKNTLNRSFMSNNTTGIIGVCYDKSRDEYVAEVKYEGKRYRFRKKMTIEEATYVRYIAFKELFGEYRNTNNDDKIFNHINKLTDQKKNELNIYVLSIVKNKLNSKFKNY